MVDPLRYASVPVPLIEGIENLAPPKGNGRLKLDMSLNVWTLGFFISVLLIAFIALDRLHTQVEILSIELKGVHDRQSIVLERLNSIETRQAILQRDLRNFPLHRHINGSRIEIYPPRPGYDDQENK